MISILTPTRRRPVEFNRMWLSAHDTSSLPIEILAYQDEDDDIALPSGVTIVKGPRIVMSDMWNRLLPCASGDLLMLGSDDIIFRTRGWDALVESAFAAVPDRILMVHGSDMGGHFSRFAAHPIVHRRWVDALGYFTPSCFTADFADTWINDIANALGRRRFVPAVIEHMHFLYKKAEVDETYQENLARHERDDPEALYDRLKPERDAAVAILRPLMDASIDTSRWTDSDDPPAGSVGECPRCGNWATTLYGEGKFCNKCGHAYG